MRIGELANKTKTRPSTLRYYEERGLLQPPDRTPGGYRSYGEESVARLEFISRARAVGLTLAQTAKILDVRDAGGSPCGHVRDLLDRRLVEIDEQVAQLRLLRASIAELREHAQQTPPETCTPESICQYL
ncbi:MAG: heavy metal-responsive transcriptional regulator [Microbacterium sp.]|uniref:heavy metal-responsive transcriptional regulator n=1 Tax=Microbacterium TaxID=33882 RepID=UPI000C48E17C|nr:MULTISPECIES: heavy metal-responsive transcriptional regulator [Microbacterium]MAY50372.1 heavy metal-responsive transcriptional regulator [Microbacterium sp.]HAS32226.1 heavy metal-responsive transcriptional regulator [Microbacterium sp.]HBR87818.1 heavy metal-responsive transcriptional regulator [Microbacterium sp.]HBS73381.1 heavy metal-responsive transcriptional regulator [Microbacterium sp.]|tara:strand:- start:958 stop:1347 length:390 start_codon:yes stop_codon:yes gene_type:complete